MTREQFALLEEILSQERFREWAMGEAPEMDDFWEAWVGNDPAKKEILLHAREIAGSFHYKTPPISEEYILEKVNQAISAGRSSVAGDETPGGTLFRKRTVPAGLLLKSAASVLLVLGLGWAGYRYLSAPDTNALQSGINTGVSRTAPSLVSVRNTDPSPRHIRLSDGSSVILQSGSAITFPETFAPGSREVRLYGEAFFEVVKNPEVPFYVLANQTVTKVVGTSFRIKAKPDVPLLEVNVKSGTVAIFTDKVTAGLNLNEYPRGRVTVLNKNEKAVFELSGNELRKQAEIADLPVRLPIEKLSFRYESTPLQTVFSDLQAAYGVNIVYDSEQLSGCSLTAELGDEPLYNKIKWICSILEADYRLSDNEITIYGKPCQ